MEKLAVIIGGRIRAARKKAGLSQEKLAELAGVHHTYIGQLERGEKNATLDSIYRVSSALKLPLSTLFEKIEQFPRGNARNIPLECYDILLTKPESIQEKLYDVILTISEIS